MLRNRLHPWLLATFVSGGLVACDSNPTIDPGVTLTAQGKALQADGTPLANAEVKLIRYFDENRIAAIRLQPSINDLFECTQGASCQIPGLSSLQIAFVKSVMTDDSGNFELKFTGAEIAVVGGMTDAMGNVEGSNLVIVVKDPGDSAGKAGVYTKDHVFSGADFTWVTGELRFWDAQATVSYDNPSVGLVGFTWNKLADPANGGRNFYRLEVGGENSAKLVIRCQAGSEVVAGGCSEVGTEQLGRSISAYSLYSYYSDAGMFSAYVNGDGVMYRFRTKFTIPPTPVPQPTGTPAGIAGIWAVGSGADQALKNTRADDNDVATREPITNNATSIYVKFESGAELSDGGLLNSLMNDAYAGCVVIETNTSVFDTIADAKSNTQGWTSKGKFCGGNGSDKALSALINFSPRQLTPWMRFRIEAGSGGNPYYQEIGEVAAFRGE